MLFISLNSSHPKRCAVISLCGFDLHFPDNNSEYFYYPVGHLYVFFGEMFVEDPN